MNNAPNLYRNPEYQKAQGWPLTAPQQAADGNLQAILYLAHSACNNGNESEGLKLYRKAARDFDNLEATLNVIKMYEFGMGCKTDLIKACQWMKKLLLMIESTPDMWEHPIIRSDVIVNYGWYMLGGKTPVKAAGPQMQLPESKRNVRDGVKWLERAAELGNAEVASTLGNIYMTGQHPKIPLSYEKGMKLLEIAAELGDGKCAYQLSVAYKIGVIPVDMDKYRYWLKKAADLGYNEAQYMLLNGDLDRDFGISESSAKRKIKKLEREKNIESMLTTDESNKCCNPSCDATETDGALFQVCSRCKHVKYCSKECQTNHWKSGHKKDCPDLKAHKDELKKLNIEMIKNRTVKNND